MQDRLLEALLLLIPSGLLTTLVYLYLNAGKPTKQVRHNVKVRCCPKIDSSHDAGRRDDPAAELQGRLGVCPQREEGGPRQVLASCQLTTIVQ